MQTAKQVQADVTALLRARNALLWIVTREEARAERALFQAAADAGYVAHTWDVAQGARDINGQQDATGVDSDWSKDPGNMLQAIDGGRRERTVWILRDLPAWLSPPVGATVSRALRNLARKLPTLPRERAQAIIVLTPDANVPAELAGHATVIEWPLPDRAEIGAILDAAIAGLPEPLQAAAAPNGAREAAIDAAVGLSGEEAASCYAKSLVQHRKIEPATVAAEKRRVIARERVLEWYDPIPGGLDAVGGLENMKAWLQLRAKAYTKQAREYGLTAPRGVLIVGVSGCGKSLTAKAVSTAWQVPLLRMDIAGLKSKFVGESEANLRRAERTIDSVGRCVVWLDEIEKALAGATQGAADGGVSQDTMGSLLTWMQERTGESFIIATANSIEGIAESNPELLRRFDAIFFVDAPTTEERIEVLGAALREHGRGDLKTVDRAKVAAATAGFTGAEIAGLVPEAMFAAFSDGAREITTADLLAAASHVVPLTKTAAERIERMRKWAAGRAQPASRATKLAPDVAGVRLDV